MGETDGCPQCGLPLEDGFCGPCNNAARLRDLYSRFEALERRVGELENMSHVHAEVKMVPEHDEAPRSASHCPHDWTDQ